MSNIEKTENIHANHRERVRSKVVKYGMQQFHDHEVLELLLFYAIPRVDTNPLAHALLERFGSIDRLFSASIHELVAVPGVGEKVAVLLKTVFEVHNRINRAVPDNMIFKTFDDVGQYFAKQYHGCDTEKALLLLMDKRGGFKRLVDVSDGDDSCAPLRVRDIMTQALSESASVVALAHNHPSGVLVPSYDDKCVTAELENVLLSLQMRFIDHFIVYGDSYIGVKQYQNAFQKQ